MKRRFRLLTWATCILGIFLAAFAVWTVSCMITGAVPIQTSRIGSIIAAFVSYMSLCVYVGRNKKAVNKEVFP